MSLNNMHRLAVTIVYDSGKEVSFVVYTTSQIEAIEASDAFDTASEAGATVTIEYQPPCPE